MKRGEINLFKEWKGIKRETTENANKNKPTEENPEVN